MTPIMPVGRLSAAAIDAYVRRDAIEAANDPMGRLRRAEAALAVLAAGRGNAYVLVFDGSHRADAVGVRPAVAFRRSRDAQGAPIDHTHIIVPRMPH